MGFVIKSEIISYEVERFIGGKFIIDQRFLSNRIKEHASEFGKNSKTPNPDLRCFKCSVEFKVGDKVRIVQFTDRSLVNRLVCSGCADLISECLNKDN